jgi:hypothetical protein
MKFRLPRESLLLGLALMAGLLGLGSSGIGSQTHFAASARHYRLGAPAAKPAVVKTRAMQPMRPAAPKPVPQSCPGSCPEACDPDPHDGVTTGNDCCLYPDTCCPDGYFLSGSCCFINGSPILLDATGEGLRLTDPDHGVWFDIGGTGVPVHLAWTLRGSRNGWLALDRNGNGTIDSGKELFGNFTPQPNSPNPNGFLALAMYDRSENGGNGNGRIDPGDSIWTQLRVWVDENHDGISEGNELYGLDQLGVPGISLDYMLSKRTDQFGNQFKYRARILDLRNADLGRWAWDVFLKIG